MFDHLLRSDATGRSWLRRLILLGSRAHEVRIPEDVGELVPGHQAWWGQNERPLRPPRELLEWLVKNVSVEPVAQSRDARETLNKRRALASWRS